MNESFKILGQNGAVSKVELEDGESLTAEMVMLYGGTRQNLAKTMEKVCQDHSPVIVTRKRNDSVVIISLEDYKALEETAYLLRSPKNMKSLIESISQLENEEGNARDLIE